MTQPPTSGDAHAVERYLPGIVLERLLSEPADRRGASCETLRGAVLFADVAGFTAMTERLARRGPVGAEEVANVLNGYFGTLMSVVLDAGGDVLKLAGDAALVFWRAQGDEALAACVERATRAALELQATLGAVTVEAHDTPLATRVAVGAGEFVVMHVGGVRDRWEIVLAGPALRQIGIASAASPGQVVLSPEAAALVSGSVRGEPLGRGLRVDALAGAATGPASGRVVRSASGAALGALRSYVPGAVRARVDAGQSEWLAELRTVAVLFIGLHGAIDAGEGDLAALHAQVRALQTALYHYEGSLNKLSVDDKGITAVAAMGLPPFAHEDDAARAVRAALRLRADLAELGVGCSIGIAHGRVFCGVVGNERRCEYTVLGDVVNLAARLMQAAGDGILCDAATTERAGARFQFEALPPIRVKGKAEPVAIHTPTDAAMSRPGDAPGRARQGVRRPLVGRQAELARIDERLRDLSGGRGGVLLLEGDAGIGKSRLVAEAVERARGRGLRVLAGHADPTERASAYYAWRPVFADLLGLAPEVQTSLEEVRAALGSNEHAARLPLLNEVLALGLPDNELTSEMRGQVRADNTHALLLDLLGAAATGAPMVLVLEDAHWMDSASLGLAFLCAKRLPSVLVLLTTRPLAAEPEDPEVRRIVGDPATARVRLAPLPADDVNALVCRRLAAASLSDRVAEVVRARAQGNPFFSEELAQGLLDAGVVVVEDGQARVAPGVDLAAIALPASVEAVITARIDRLSPDEQLTLKVASVIGRVFDLDLLCDVHPTVPREALVAVLARLEERELVARDRGALAPTYVFRHALIVEAVYALMLYAQRRQLHRAVAERLERGASAPAAPPPWGLLAHHWTQAGDEARAFPCLENAGEQALRSGAYVEAAELLSQAVRLCPADADRVRAGRLERLLGEAEYGLGKLDVARGHLERSLELLRSEPSWAKGLPARLLSGLATQALSRLAPPAAARLLLPHDAANLERARAWGLLLMVHFFRGEPEKLLAAALHGLNEAERAGPSPELAGAYAGLAVPSGLIGLNRLAEAYLQRARQVARAVDEKTSSGMVLAWAGVHWTGRGEWCKAREDLRAALHVFDALGDRRRWTEVACALSTVAHYEGRFEERLALGAEVSARGRDTHDVQSQAWGMLDRAESLIPLGRERDALDLLAAVTPMLDQIPKTDQLWAHGLAATALTRTGDLGRARAEAERALRLMREVPPTNFYVMEGYAGAAETFLALGGSDRDEAWACALECISYLSRYARAMPFAVPRLEVCRGLASWRRGQRRDAHRAWRKAIEAAERLAMPYEAAKARYERGRHLDREDPARAPTLAAAADGFERIGAARDAGLARDALSGRSGATSPSA